MWELKSESYFVFKSNVKSFWFCFSQVKDVLYHLYKTSRGNLQRLMPKEIRILKYLLTIKDPEERMSALNDAFTPGEELQGMDVDCLYTYVFCLKPCYSIFFLCVLSPMHGHKIYYFVAVILRPPILFLFSYPQLRQKTCDSDRTPEELHTWIGTVVDAYHFSREGTLIREARDMMNPKVIQKLEELKKIIQDNFMWACMLFEFLWFFTLQHALGEMRARANESKNKSTSTCTSTMTSW